MRWGYVRARVQPFRDVRLGARNYYSGRARSIGHFAKPPRGSAAGGAATHVIITYAEQPSTYTSVPVR